MRFIDLPEIGEWPPIAGGSYSRGGSFATSYNEYVLTRVHDAHSEADRNVDFDAAQTIDATPDRLAIPGLDPALAVKIREWLRTKVGSKLNVIGQMPFPAG